MAEIALLAPLSGVMVPIEQVPDPVFASRMVGDGVSIDPLSDCLLAPFDARVTQVHSAGHALTLTHASGLEIIMHIGLDTVALKGRGFQPCVAAGETVTAGQRVIAFDVDAVARGARSLLTQIVVPSADLVARLVPSSGQVTAGRDVVLRVYLRDTADALDAQEAARGTAVSGPVEVTLAQGLHARPAALLASRARAFRSEVSIVVGERRANVKSVTAVMALEIGRGRHVLFEGTGDDADAAVAALAQMLAEGLGEGETPMHSASASWEAPSTRAPRPRPADPEGLLRGVGASPGLAVGCIFHLRRQSIEVSEQGADAASERRTLERALQQARVALETLQGQVAAAADAQEAAIFGAHRELLDDPDLAGRVSALLSRGKSAGYAWREACDALAAQLSGLSNPLLAQRANDVRDVRDRVLRLIVGTEEGPTDVPRDSVLIADDLTPSDTATLDRERVLGFATLLGGPTSHVAILARSLDLPAIVAIDPRAAALDEGTLVVLDGTDGTLRADPPADVIEVARSRISEMAARREQARARSDQAAVTRDGRAVEVAANIGKIDEAGLAVSHGAEGVGLLRSEVFFMGRDTPPSEDEQADAYAIVARALGPHRRLVIRTLDVGGDKPLPFLPVGAEENPFLGERGLRLCLNRPDILRTQMRAILRAAGLAQIHVMLPMVTTIDELRQARAIFEQERASLGAPPVPLGVMIEVPAAALAADALAREADFFSVGTNDLTQYALAVDRGHPRIAALADALHPAVLRLVGMAADAAHAHGRWIGVCGGVAADPAAIPLLVGLGVDELSVPVPAIPAVKECVRALDTGACRRLAARALAAESAAAVRALTAETPTEVA